MQRKLKVVGISTENNQETLDNDVVAEIPNEEKHIGNEPVETVKEITQETIKEEEVKEPEPAKEEIKDSGPGGPTEPKTKIKTSELVQCPRCKRSMAEKTLKFIHEETCKEKADVYIPKTLQNKKKKTNEITGVVKEAIGTIEQETEVKRPKDIFKPMRQASQPPTHSLEPAQERLPLYSDLRRERTEKHNNKMTHVFQKSIRLIN